MSLLVPAAFFVLGAFIASFVGVIVARLHTGQSMLIGRSRCDACNTPLAPASLLPIIAPFVLSRHAHCCGVRLSLVPPLSELILGGLFIFVYRTVGVTPALPVMLVSLSLLLALVLYDLRHQILPSVLLGAFLVTSAVTRFLLTPSLADFLFSVSVALLIALPLALFHFLSGGRMMGFSDAPLAFALALLVGSAAVSGFVFSFWIGAVVGLCLLARRPRGSILGVEVPFAPYLAAGFLLAYCTQWNPFVFALALPR